MMAELNLSKQNVPGISHQGKNNIASGIFFFPFEKPQNALLLPLANKEEFFSLTYVRGKWFFQESLDLPLKLQETPLCMGTAAEHWWADWGEWRSYNRVSSAEFSEIEL